MNMVGVIGAFCIGLLFCFLLYREQQKKKKKNS